MNILMIGNGFDLEHGLPTKYTDFLKFIKDFNHAYYSPSNEDAIRKFEDTYFSRFHDNKDIINALRKLIYKNLWIDYFIKVHDERLFQKENWIDFESEISLIVQTMERLIKYYENYRLTGAEDPVLYNFYMDTLTKFIDKESLEIDTISSNIKPMIFDLNRLICALEIYIKYYITHIEIQYYNPDILYNSFDKVISFNYSDTYTRLYAVDYADTDYHFVHGYPRFILDEFCIQCADATPDLLERYMSQNKMVLGIDEYLSDDRKDKDVDFLPFKKYYQRIYKNTTSQYKNWLKEIDTNPESNRQNTLHIFGHSLDVTDGDILRDLMNHNGIKTVIYYKTKQQLGQQITNLVKVLGSDAVVEKVYGNSSITFIHQSTRHKINDISEICIDITHINQMRKASKAGVNILLSKINTNIEQGNLKYFRSQDMVITLFDTLQKIGLGAKYFEKLLEIAYKCEVSLFFDYQEWTYQHYDHSYKCDSHTTHFIDCINQHNSNVTTDANYKNPIFKYNHISQRQISLDKTQYSKLVKEMLDDTHYFTHDQLLLYLVQISCGPAAKIARKTIQELINETDNDYDLIQYNHLLQLMDEYEYINNGA